MLSVSIGQMASVIGIIIWNFRNPEQMVGFNSMVASTTKVQFIAYVFL